MKQLKDKGLDALSRVDYTADVEAALKKHSRKTFSFQDLFAPVDASSLGLFRILFGLILAGEVIHCFAAGYIYSDYIQPRSFFPYPYLGWIKPWSAWGMYLHFALLGFLGAAISAGWHYRAAAGGASVLFAYIFFLDKTWYLNHYYLMLLLLCLLAVTDTHKWLSFDQARNRWPRAGAIARWQLWIFRLQIVIVYFYAGAAKIDADWLRGEPLRHWFKDSLTLHVRTGITLFSQEWFIMSCAYGAMLLDLSLGFLLLAPKLRRAGICLACVFHGLNLWLFPTIGPFPYVMLSALILFIDPEAPRRWLERFKRNVPRSDRIEPTPFQPSKLSAALIACALAFQILFPLRHWFYPGNASWTEEGQRFAWRMMLREKTGRIAFRIYDAESKQNWNVAMDKHLTNKQIQKMSIQPDMILQYASFLKQQSLRAGVKKPQVYADSWASVNGRPFKRFINPDIDLGTVNGAFWGRKKWILPSPDELPPGTDWPKPAAEYLYYDSAGKLLGSKQQ